MKQSAVVKYLLIFLGLFFVCVGFIGIAVPGLPTTIFLIIAATCFAKSSPCLHAWLMYHVWFGPILLNWQKNRSIPRKAKFIALISMGLACIYTCLILDSIVIKVTIFVVMVFPAVFLYRLPFSENVRSASPNQLPQAKPK